MNYSHLNDREFLKKIDLMGLRTQYSKITLLSFDEKVIGEIEGQITGGSVNVNGSAAIRRTISLTMLANPDNANIENLDNQISINKKVKIEIGYKNPFKNYLHYGDIVWFPCGVYIISSASISRSTSGWTISVNGKDKMCLLDGSVGGVLPASVAFHEIYNFVDDNSTDIVIEYPTIYTIIKSAVTYYGKENVNNILINDLDIDATILIRYIGEEPIYFDTNFNVFTFNLDEAKTWGNYHKYIYGQDVGYKATDFTYPGELVLNAGDTVVTLLDKIAKTLGNYEFFYDIDGHFVFQQIKNYLNTASPINQLTAADYTRNYSNTTYAYSIPDLNNVTSIQLSPKYDNIKNDFIVWGTRKSTTGTETPIRYHLAIDSKPTAYYTTMNMRQTRIKQEEGSWNTSIETLTREFTKVSITANVFTRGRYYIKNVKSNSYSLSLEYEADTDYYVCNLQEVTIESKNYSPNRYFVKSQAGEYTISTANYSEGVQYYDDYTWDKDYCLIFDVDTSSYKDNTYYTSKYNTEGHQGPFELSTSFSAEQTYYALLKQEQTYSSLPAATATKKDDGSIEITLTNNDANPIDYDVYRELYNSKTYYYNDTSEVTEGIKTWDGWHRHFVHYTKSFEEYMVEKESIIIYESDSNIKHFHIGYALQDNEYEWREELYRRALVANANGDTYGHYDEELIAEWRKLYDPNNPNWLEYDHWNPYVKKDPAQLDYWLDFIDEQSTVGKYSIKAIGRRSKVINDKDATLLYAPMLTTPVLFIYMDEIFPDNFDDSEYERFQLPKQYSDMFVPSTTGTSCFDKLRELLYQNLTYNTTITISCMPKYYYEPNNILYIQDKTSGINGNYVISQFSLPLTYNGTMSITATEALTRV